MSAFFASASTQFIGNSVTPVTGYPFTVGVWAQSTTTGLAAKSVFSNASSSAQDRFCLTKSTSDTWIIFAVTGAGSSSSGGTAAVVIGQWVYLVGRFINATNRRLAVLAADGTITHTATSFSTSPTPTRMSLGNAWWSTPGENFDGSIAEFFIANSDIQADGLQLSDQTLRQLAYGGPFSVPYIAKDIVDYRSLRYALGSDNDGQPDYEMGNKGRQTWVNTNGVIRAAHPPLPPGYRGPADIIRTGIV